MGISCTRQKRGANMKLNWSHPVKSHPPLRIYSFFTCWPATDRAWHFTTAQMFIVSQVIGSCRKKSSRTALACHTPKSDLTSDTRVTDLASNLKNVNN